MYKLNSININISNYKPMEGIQNPASADIGLYISRGNHKSTRTGQISHINKIEGNIGNRQKLKSTHGRVDELEFTNVMFFYRKNKINSSWSKSNILDIVKFLLLIDIVTIKIKKYSCVKSNCNESLFTAQLGQPNYMINTSMTCGTTYQQNQNLHTGIDYYFISSSFKL